MMHDIDQLARLTLFGSSTEGGFCTVPTHGWLRETCIYIVVWEDCFALSC
jgi:hypothetical protein